MLYSDYNAEQNAENSYFSVSAIVAAVSEYIQNEESLQLLEESLKPYYIPAFVLNVTSNYVTISVYPLYGEKETVQIERVEGSVPSIISGPAEASSVIVEQYEQISPLENVISVELNPASKTDSPIKRPLGLELAEETGIDWLSNNNGWQPIENLLTCNFPFDSTGAINETTEKWECEDTQIIANLRSKLQIICDVVASQIEGLDPDVYDSVVENYKTWETKITSLTELLSDISEQQSEVIKLLNIDSLMSSYFPLSSDENVIDGTQFNDVLENLWEKISNIFTLDSNSSGVVLERFSNFYVGEPDSGGSILSMDASSEGYSFGESLGFISEGSSDNHYIPYAEEKAYRSFLELYINESSEILEKYNQLKTTPLSELESSTVLDWYTQEIDAKMNDKESVGGAQSWISSNQSSIDTMKMLMDLDITSGAGQLYSQCFLKAIQDLVNSNVNIADYLGTKNGESWFDLVGQNPTIGLTKSGIAPNLTLGDISDNEVAAEDGQDPIHTEPVEINDLKYINFNLLLYILRAIKPLELYKFIENSTDGGDIGLDSHSGLQVIREEFLNNGNLEERSNGCFFNIGDILRSDKIGGLPVHPVVTQSSGTHRWHQFQNAGEFGEGHRLWNHFSGIDFNSSETLFFPVLSYTRGALLNAETVMGINYYYPKKDGQNPDDIETKKPHLSSTAWNYGKNQLGGRNSRYGLIDFHTVAEVSYSDEAIYRSDAFSEASYVQLEETNQTGFVDMSSGFMINNFRETNRKVISIFEAPSETKKYFSEWYKSHIDNNPSRGNMGISLMSTNGGHVIPTGVCTGMICFTSPFDEEETQAPTFVEKAREVTQPRNGCFELAWFDDWETDGRGLEPPQGFFRWDAYKDTDPLTGSIFQNFTNQYGKKWPVYKEKPVYECWEWYERGPNDEAILKEECGWVVKGEPTGWHQNTEVRHAFALDGEGNYDWIFPLQWKNTNRNKRTDSNSNNSYWNYPARELTIAQNNDTDLESMTNYLMMKGGGVLRAFGMIEGILKGLYRLTHEHLLVALNEVTGENLNYDNFLKQGILENETVLNNWIRVLDSSISKFNTSYFDFNDWKLRVNYDGKFVLMDENLYGRTRGETIIDSDIRSKYTGALGDGNRTLIKNYAKFVSMVSMETKAKKVSADALKREYKWSEIFPLGVLASSANSTYNAGHGKPSYYGILYSPSFLRDSLRYADADFQDISSLEIQKYLPNPYGSVPMGGLYNWIVANKLFLGTRQFLDDITEPMEDFIDYIEDLTIADDLKEVYLEGLVTVDDIANSSKILQLVNSNIQKYSPDEQGISKRWVSLFSNYSTTFGSLLSSISGISSDTNTPGKWFLCHLGISEDFVQWTLSRNISLYITIDTVTSGWASVDMSTYGMYLPKTASGTIHRRAIKINNGVFTAVNANKSDDPDVDLVLSSKILSQWTHFVKGFDMDEATFVERNEQIYSEFLQNNDSGIFPWSSSDFENGKPIRELESIYNVSSWLFPKNYFMEVIKPRDFRKIIPVLVYVPQNNSGAFLGNIKFKISSNYENNPLWQ